MRTIHRLSVDGESQKYFSTSLSEMKNGTASNSKTIIKEELLNSGWFKNDTKLFKRTASMEALKRAWSMITNKLGSLITRSIILNYLNKFNLKSDGVTIDYFYFDRMIGKYLN